MAALMTPLSLQELDDEKEKRARQKGSLSGIAAE
jgi:hypothetical protein